MIRRGPAHDTFNRHCGTQDACGYVGRARVKTFITAKFADDKYVYRHNAEYPDEVELYEIPLSMCAEVYDDVAYDKSPFVDPNNFSRDSQRVKYDLKDMAWSVVVLLTIAAITFVILGM